MFLVGGEGDVVHSGTVAAGQRGVVDGVFAPEPRGVGDACIVTDVLSGAKTQLFEVFPASRHIRGHLIEVVEAYQGARSLDVVAPGHALDMHDVVEELVGETQRVLHPDAVSDSAGESARTTLGAHAERLVVGLGTVDILGAADPEGERSHRGDRAPAQHQIVVDELLERPQIDCVRGFLGDDQTQDVDVEIP